MNALVVAAMAAVALSTAAHAQDASLKLRCEGVSRHVVADQTSLSAADNYGREFTGEATRFTRQQTDASLSFEMAGGAARVRLPSDMVPLISGGGTQGWWNVTDLRVSDDEIAGRYSLNVLNHPRIRIDRRTGMIDVEGRRAFHGQCESVADAPRRF